jgi:hypothetical protein
MDECAMNYRLTKQTTGLVLAAALTVFASTGTALAHGGGGGGGHGGGGRFGGGHVTGVGHWGESGYRGGHFGGGWHRGGHRGYPGYGWRGGWGWGNLGIGLYFATLPYYYSTFWDAGVPYYYADDNYYLWDSNVGQYETVNPPAEVQRQAEEFSNLIAYPRNGQTEAKQAEDRSDCRKWAASIRKP